MNWSALSLAFALLLIIPSASYPHGGNEHPNADRENRRSKPVLDEDGFEVIDEGPSQAQLRAINQNYVRTVKPIFEKKCFDCHGGSTRYPWYYKLPGAKQLIDDDIREAKKHMDMSNDFPFKGHGSPEDDLEAVADVVKSGEMPPMRYWIMHWDSRLTSEEKQVILDWVENSRKILGSSQVE